VNGRVALVTGGNRGIGAAISRVFAAAGARVAVHGRDAAAADAVAGEIRAAGGEAVAVLGDVLGGGPPSTPPSRTRRPRPGSSC
jgi:3-oxoacyl-[acyl-carrier protein] reductase